MLLLKKVSLWMSGFCGMSLGFIFIMHFISKGKVRIAEAELHRNVHLGPAFFRVVVCKHAFNE